MLLSLVPIAAGAVRLSELVRDAPLTSANARFFAMPLPVILHIIAIAPYSILGAWQFVPAFRRRNPGWHRAAGCALVVFGLTTALTGLWMTQCYPWPQGDGKALYALRLIAGSAMVMLIVLGVVAIRLRNLATHGAWMMRSYAIGMGAVTQVLTHAPYLLLIGQPSEPARAVLMGSGWVINVVIAEWLILRKPSRLASV